VLYECDFEGREWWDSMTSHASPANVQFQMTIPSQRIVCNMQKSTYFKNYAHQHATTVITCFCLTLLTAYLFWSYSGFSQLSEKQSLVITEADFYSLGWLSGTQLTVLEQCREVTALTPLTGLYQIKSNLTLL